MLNASKDIRHHTQDCTSWAYLSIIFPDLFILFVELQRGGVSVGDMGADMRHLRDLNDELESQLNQLHSDLNEAELKLVDERDACDKVFQ